MNNFEELYYELLSKLRKCSPIQNNKQFTNREITAFHEAGHTVYAYNYCLPLYYVKIFKNEKRGVTKVKFDKNNIDKYPDYVKLIFSGIISQYIYTGILRCGDFCNDFYGQKDNHTFPYLYGKFHCDNEKLIQIFNNTICETKKRKIQIELIKSELINKGMLKREQVLKILNEYKPQVERSKPG